MSVASLAVCWSYWFSTRSYTAVTFYSVFGASVLCHCYSIRSVVTRNGTKQSQSSNFCNSFIDGVVSVPPWEFAHTVAIWRWSWSSEVSRRWRYTICWKGERQPNSVIEWFYVRGYSGPHVQRGSIIVTFSRRRYVRKYVTPLISLWTSLFGTPMSTI